MIGEWGEEEHFGLFLFFVFVCCFLVFWVFLFFGKLRLPVCFVVRSFVFTLLFIFC